MVDWLQMGVLIASGCLLISQCEMHLDKAAAHTPGLLLALSRLLRLVLGLTASAIQRQCIHHWRWVIDRGLHFEGFGNSVHKWMAHGPTTHQGWGWKWGSRWQWLRHWGLHSLSRGTHMA